MIGNDTIAAISTPAGTGGISIIRISGVHAFDIMDVIFKGNRKFSQLESHTMGYGKIVDPHTGQMVDEVLVSKMKKPRTFTREDVAEINCHGGMVVVRRVLELVLGLGARAAEPGEFTKRAFLNGRMDLSQAEAVIDLIQSKTDAGSRAAVEQLEGRLSRKLGEIRQVMIGLIAHIEVTVDYPEHDIEEITGQQVYSELRTLIEKTSILLRGFERGKIIREGINAVIVGKPNVGKSSLLNELAGKNKAIVTDIPGTTRDIVEEYVNIGGIPVKFTDTAGIRDTEDVVEKMGVEKAHKALETADLVIMMLDAGQGVGEEDHQILEKLKHKKVILLLNKIDITENINLGNLPENMKMIRTSIKQDIGMEELERSIVDLFHAGEVALNSEVLVTNVRHKQLIEQALSSMKEGCAAYEGGMPLDCITIDIKNAADYLGQITGESISEDVMAEIFSRFCIGK